MTDENKTSADTTEETVTPAAVPEKGQTAKDKAPKKGEKKSTKSAKPSFWKRMGDFFKSYIGELKKITWPTAKQTFKNTGTVLLAMLIMGVFVCLLDAGFMYLVELLMKIGA